MVRAPRPPRIASAALVAGAVVASACVAPPLGIGSGADLHAAVPGQFTGAFAAGVAHDRETFQAEAAYTVERKGNRTMDAGVVVTELGVERSDTSRTYVGAAPYFRPRWTHGASSTALAISAFGFSGGEDGILGMLVDVQHGLGGSWWSVYAGAYGLVFLSTFGPQNAAAQGRLGAELLTSVPGGRIGLALEVYGQADWLGGAGANGGMLDRDTAVQPGIGLKLRFESPAASRSSGR
jgi:hypothetical protein